MGSYADLHALMFVKGLDRHLANMGHLAEKPLRCDFSHFMHPRRHRYVYQSEP